ncbi:laccase-2-like [Diprion similis]|uniref:laccase-2-like n=1 Tax=Diprion similis TaxID=362088 RepID=UPI001EF896E9|nr:laccase-2-like [Diprion similis]
MLLHGAFLVHLAFTCISASARYHHGYSGNHDNEIDFNEPDDGQGKYLEPNFSTPEECARACRDDEMPRYCYYQFILEYYATMNRACELCKPNNTNQISNVPQCQCIEADGFERGMLSINRMLPGPSIQVCQDDIIVVDVRNNIEGMEVAIHWHGIWQQDYQYFDGVPFLTQCPITSGTTFRYQFAASNPGTHFYHSHAGLQKIDGQYGSLIVRQPPSADPYTSLYEMDLLTHVILLSDWMHEMSSERFPGRVKNNPGQVPENVLINGKGRWKDPATNKTTSVQLETFVVQTGKKYRFRMINAFSSVCPAQMTIEGHSLTLIAQDGESVEPISVDTIVSSSGERVDFILDANQAVGTYWIQVRAIGECIRFSPSQVAILKYTGGSGSPKTPQPSYRAGLKQGIVYNPLDAKCDVPRPDAVCPNQLKSLAPVPREVLKAQPDHRIILPYRFHSYNNSVHNLFKPGSYPRFLVAADADHLTSLVDGISFVFPEVPPLSQSITGSDTCNRINLPRNCGIPCECPHTHHIKKGAIVEVVIYDEVSQPMLGHPFHLHGYSFKILKIGRFTDGRNISKNDIAGVIHEHQMMLDSAQYVRPAGKDTVSVPHAGYVIFRFKADNPGWWLLHCHFLYHISIGMNAIFHVGEKTDLPPVPPMFPTCHSYTPEVRPNFPYSYKGNSSTR